MDFRMLRQSSSIGMRRRNYYSTVTLVLFVLIVVRGGDVVRSAALNKYPSVQFVTDNGLSNAAAAASDDYYRSVHKSRIDNKQSSIDKENDHTNNNNGNGHDANDIHDKTHGLIADDIYWGPLIEASYPQGFTSQNYTDWDDYVHSDRTRIVQLEQDKCGRMQNRLLTFADGTLGCARYRQNTDQIQGELFSYYLGQLLKLTNMAPTALQIVDEDTRFWANASVAVQEAGWRAQRPVVLTKHIPRLVPAGIPSTFQKLERHLNKFDVTLGLDGMRNSLFEEGSGGASAAAAELVGGGNLLADRATLSSTSKIWPGINWFNIKSSSAAAAAASVAHPPPLGNLIELAQWSDLVVFDYLIAHLDRVVNNLYNYQWNSEIMAAPAHNLVKDPATELLLFLDNESGLLHGYRLLSKYQAYHSLLLENLCVFRRSTIDQVCDLVHFSYSTRRAGIK